MWRRKKFIIITLAAVLLVGSAVGVVLAADNGDENGSAPEAQHGALLDRVCAIYEENTGTTIDPQALQDAFAEARSEMWEGCLDSRLQNLVEQGKITQEQADAYKAWLQSRPEVPIRHGLCGRGGHRFGRGPCPAME